MEMFPYAEEEFEFCVVLTSFARKLKLKHPRKSFKPSNPMVHKVAISLLFGIPFSAPSTQLYVTLRDPIEKETGRRCILPLYNVQYHLCLHSTAQIINVGCLSISKTV
eukprot:TCONS_00067115-protein